MNAKSESPNIVVLGAGAVGCYFGGMLARAGHKVTLVARTEHVAAITQHGLHMVFDGLDREAEAPRNVLVRFALEQQAQHIGLARGESHRFEGRAGGPVFRSAGASGE